MLKIISSVTEFYPQKPRFGPWRATRTLVSTRGSWVLSPDFDVFVASPSGGRAGEHAGWRSGW
jgi:hypothetical protein